MCQDSELRFLLRGRCFKINQLAKVERHELFDIDTGVIDMLPNFWQRRTIVIYAVVPCLPVKPATSNVIRLSILALKASGLGKEGREKTAEKPLLARYE
ncbi:hypothetical protein L204_102777 [Cryptococcus depauperatus]